MEQDSDCQVNGRYREGLNIAVVGAGIGGLAAAICLMQQRHQVQIYESSKFASELGAAIHIQPNAFGLLKRMGIDPFLTGANECKFVTSYAAEGQEIDSVDLTATASLWQHPWVLGHRIKVHAALKEKAVKMGAELFLGKAVTKVEPMSGTIELVDGSRVVADVVIGADGIHSVCRKALVGDDWQPFSSGKSAFRFLIPRKAAIDDPQTRKYAKRDGELLLIYGQDRRIVVYPTSDNTLLNFVCIHPEEETIAASSSDWNNEANKGLLCKVFEKFHGNFQALLEKVDESSLKVWRLMDMNPLPAWQVGKLALLGDAAHPFLPHQGQGGAMAIEDAAALGVLLEPGIRPAEIEERLELYQKVRQTRADKIQQYSRLAGEDLVSGERASTNMMEFMAYNLGHDAYDNAAQRLREWKWSTQPASYWRMPLAFGPMPGPRQTHRGQVRNGTIGRFVTASMKIKTSRTVLQNLFPPGSAAWSFTSPGSVAFCSFSQTTLDGMEWLGGKGYNHFGLYIHGVQYRADNGSVTKGVYLPILFESLTDPIVSGREELGMPKLFSDIEIIRTESSYSIKAAWRGAVWGTLDLHGLGPTDSKNVAGKMTGDDNDEGVLVQRYMPKVGRKHKGVADVSHAVFDCFSEAEPQPAVQRSWQAETAALKLHPGDWKSLPTLHHIISRLAEIPIYEVVSARVVEGKGVPDVAAAVRI